jgi:TPP-dependent pyruvate/acetoin dehydrogenase alpha subunit
MTNALMKSEFKQNLYNGMLRIRIVEERIAELYSEQEMRCPVHLCTGQEAIAVGASSVLENRDYVFSGHRAHGHYLAKGGDLNRMMSEIYGREGGCARGNGGSMHLIDLSVNFMGATPIVGSTIPIAVGAAFTAKMKNENAVSVVYFGDGATETGVFHESVNFAAVHALPVIFICEDNLYSVYTSFDERQSAKRDIIKLVQGHGVYGVEGDGNNVEEVCNLTSIAVNRARSGEGPCFLKFSTYRWREHCGPNFDNDIGYRTEDEFLMWKSKCPIKTYGTDLKSANIMSEKKCDKLTAKYLNEMNEAVQFAKNQPFPSSNTAFNDIYDAQ